jgi:16S rRNA (cytosine1402-N4)-methyltransferase
MDLGVSSHHFDESDRGFSYRNDAKLDMRMDRGGQKNASDIINFADENELTRILGEFGEVRNPHRMAKKIVSARNDKKIETTKEFVSVLNEEYGELQNAVLSKIFQAFRIAVNGELDELTSALRDSLEFLNGGGRLVVISYHSLEDRIVKNFLRENAKDCICPPQLPKCVCENKAKIKVITKKSHVATENEILDNRRARSAKLRCGERI